MKITKRQLRQIIKEEKASLMRESQEHPLDVHFADRKEFNVGGMGRGLRNLLSRIKPDADRIRSDALTGFEKVRHDTFLALRDKYGTERKGMLDYMTTYEYDDKDITSALADIPDDIKDFVLPEYEESSAKYNAYRAEVDMFDAETAAIDGILADLKKIGADALATKLDRMIQKSMLRDVYPRLERVLAIIPQNIQDKLDGKVSDLVLRAQELSNKITPEMEKLADATRGIKEGKQMKITKRQLRRIIKEEKTKILAERKVRQIVRRRLIEQQQMGLPGIPQAQPFDDFGMEALEHIVFDLGVDLTDDAEIQEIIYNEEPDYPDNTAVYEKLLKMPPEARMAVQKQLEETSPYA